MHSEPKRGTTPPFSLKLAGFAFASLTETAARATAAGVAVAHRSADTDGCRSSLYINVRTTSICRERKGLLRRPDGRPANREVFITRRTQDHTLRCQLPLQLGPEPPDPGITRVPRHRGSQSGRQTAAAEAAPGRRQTVSSVSSRSMAGSLSHSAVQCPRNSPIKSNRWNDFSNSRSRPRSRSGPVQRKRVDDFFRFFQSPHKRLEHSVK